MTPLRTVDCSISPPGTFSTRAYRLRSTVLMPASSCETVRTACNASLHIRSDHRTVNFVPIEVLIRESISSSFLTSIGIEILSIIDRASFSALLNAEMMTTGWMLRSNGPIDWARISAATFIRVQNPSLGRKKRFVYAPRMMTLVVPSPHSSSCVLLSSIMFFAAGCTTSTLRKIALPSFVILDRIRAQKI